MPYKFSPSSLSLLKDCPRCFWLYFNKDIKRPDTVFPSLPSGMDRILKEHFDFFMKKGELPPELQQLNGEVKLFDNEELLKVWRSNFKGIQWTDKKGNLLHGAIDNLLTKGKKLIVLDYKTRGFPLKEDTHEHYQDQMDIYNLLLRKNGYETEDYTYLLFYHPHKVEPNGHVCFNTDLVKIKVNLKNAENIFKKALEVLNGDCPEPSEECGFCGWVDAYLMAFEERDSFKESLEESSRKAIKNCCCKDCGGVIVKSWLTGIMAVSHGKRCSCKKK